MASNDEVAKILAMLAASYPRFQLTRETIAAYVQLLGDIPTDALKAGAMHCATSGTFFPSVHELRQAVMNLNRIASNVPDAYTAWHDVSTGPRAEWLKSLSEEDSKFYIDEHPRLWTHPFVERVAKLLGWPDSFPGENVVADRAHFYKAYEQLLDKELSNQGRLPAVQSYIDNKSQRLLEVTHGNDGRTIVQLADKTN